MSIILTLGIVAVGNLAIGYALALALEGWQQPAAGALPMPAAVPRAANAIQAQPVATPTASANEAATTASPNQPPAASVAPDAAAEQLLASARALSDDLQQLAGGGSEEGADAIGRAASNRTPEKPEPTAIAPKPVSTEPAPSIAPSEQVSAEPRAQIATPAELESAFHDWHQNEPAGARPFSVGQVEIDHMPQLMAKLDVAALNGLAKQVERLIQCTLREEDLLAPLGRSRFLVVMPDITGAAAADLLESLRSRMQQTDFSTDRGPIRATLSASATQARNDESIESLLARSAIALREACREGRNRVACDDGNIVSITGDASPNPNR